MDFDVERVELPANVAIASGIIRQSWPPSFPLCREDYLDWFFSFPSPLHPLGVLVYGEGHPVGFGALVPRRVRLAGQATAYVYLLTLISVLPSWRRHGVGLLLYKKLFALSAERSIPFLAFTEQGGPGENLLRRACSVHAMPHRELASHVGYAALTHSDNPGGQIGVRMTQDASELLTVLERRATDNAILDEADASGLSHWKACPLPHRVALFSHPAEGLLGGAILTRRRFAGSDGDGEKLVAERAILPGATPEALGALRYAAGQSWADGGRFSTVLSTNLGPVPPEIIRRGGFRRLPIGSYRVFVGANDPSCPFLSADQTDLNVS
ncbi:MAG TPA: GNAT family N-acetyltransferase [Gemmataceae bacterium]|nr:GNAT family N-acetyltransferase [Gemmataceae bacterium]